MEHSLFAAFLPKCVGTGIWVGFGTAMWGDKQGAKLPPSPFVQGLELWKKWTYCSLDFSREQYIRPRSLSVSSPVRLS